MDNELDYLVTTMNTYATNKGWSFAHDFLSGVNQKENEGDTTTYLQLFDLKILPQVEDIGVNFNTFQADIFIGMQSKVQDVFYKQEKGVSGVDTKYKKHFKPLFVDMKGLVNYMSVCDELSFERISPIVKKINYQDHNLDGYLINATIKVY